MPKKPKHNTEYIVRLTDSIAAAHEKGGIKSENDVNVAITRIAQYESDLDLVTRCMKALSGARMNKGYMGVINTMLFFEKEGVFNELHLIKKRLDAKMKDEIYVSDLNAHKIFAACCDILKLQEIVRKEAEKQISLASKQVAEPQNPDTFNSSTASMPKQERFDPFILFLSGMATAFTVVYCFLEGYAIPGSLLAGILIGLPCFSIITIIRNFIKK